MSILQNYYKKIVRYDLINKFEYTRIEHIPKLKKIILNFGCKSDEIKIISSSLFALELITTKEGSLTRAKRSNILLKIRKGYPVGCIVILKKVKMYDFLTKLLCEVFPNFKDFKEMAFAKNITSSSFSFTLKDLGYFKGLEKQFYLFSHLPPLNITLSTNTKTNEELLYLLQALKLPIVS